MNRQTFDNAMGEVFAAFQKPAPRPAVLDAIFKRVADFPDEFVFWASDQLVDGDKLPANLGRELRRMLPAWKAEAMPACQPDPWANECSGDPNCPDCGGTGWHYVYPLGKLYQPGLAPYAIPCLCNTVVDAWEQAPKKASLDDLKRSGRWTMRPPVTLRSGPRKPMARSLSQFMADLKAGRGLQEEAPDPRRQMPEYLQ